MSNVVRLDVGPRGRVAVLTSFALLILIKFGMDLLGQRSANLANDVDAAARFAANLVGDVVATGLIVGTFLVLAIPALLRVRRVSSIAGVGGLKLIARSNNDFRRLVNSSSTLISFHNGSTAPRLGITTTLVFVGREVEVWARTKKVAVFSSATIRVVPRVEGFREFFALEITAENGSAAQVVVVDKFTTLFPLSEAELQEIVNHITLPAST